MNLLKLKYFIVYLLSLCEFTKHNSYNNFDKKTVESVIKVSTQKQTHISIPHRMKQKNSLTSIKSFFKTS